MKVDSAVGEGYSCHFCDLDATVKLRALMPRRDSSRRRVAWVYACFVCQARAEREASSPLRSFFPGR
jgi:hypothetical protein